MGDPNSNDFRGRDRFDGDPQWRGNTRNTNSQHSGNSRNNYNPQAMSNPSSSQGYRNSGTYNPQWRDNASSSHSERSGNVGRNNPQWSGNAGTSNSQRSGNDGSNNSQWRSNTNQNAQRRGNNNYPNQQISLASNPPRTRINNNPGSSSSNVSNSNAYPFSNNNPVPTRGGSRGGFRGGSGGGSRGRPTYPHPTQPRTNVVNSSKQGANGQQVALTANYFRVATPTWQIFQYHVSFTPEIDITHGRKKLLRNVIDHEELFAGYTFDGANLYTTIKLREAVTEKACVRREDNETFKITIKYTQEINKHSEVIFMICNNILRRAMEKLELKLVGRNFFDDQKKIDIPQYNIQLWPGYITSIRQHEHEVLLCAEITTKIMRKDTLHDELLECIRNDEANYREKFCKNVIGATVLCKYSNKSYRIDDVDWSKTAESTFTTRDGAISYIDYYQTRYTIKIRDRHQPLLLSRSKDRRIRAGEKNVIALIPELCYATGLTDELKNDFHVLKEIARHTRVNPADRIQRLCQFNNRLKSTKASMDQLKEWNMKLSDELVTLNGRELPAQMIQFGDSKEQSAGHQADWTHPIKSNKLYSPVSLDNWYIVATNDDSSAATNFVKVMREAVKTMGIHISDPLIERIKSYRNEDIIKGIEMVLRKDPRFIMIVVSNNNADRYAAIKKKCCVLNAVPTQVILAKNIKPNTKFPGFLRSVATKVAIQVNCKLGGIPWHVHIPLDGIMFCGFDVTHDTRNKRLSYGALVCSMDMQRSNKYFSAVMPHECGEEISNALPGNMIKAIKAYYDEIKALPKGIIFYRDGVGEGQINYVEQHEVQNLRKILTEQYQRQGKELRLTYILVNKRINTRLFKAKQNPSPGTVVDDVITLPERKDFFLISQKVNQGTVTPSSYTVVEDTLQMPMENLQTLTYRLTHLYYNWSGTIRVPALCQYAHKLAFLVGQSLHAAPQDGLNNRLYFL